MIKNFLKGTDAPNTYIIDLDAIWKMDLVGGTICYRVKYSEEPFSIQFADPASAKDMYETILKTIVDPNSEIQTARVSGEIWKES
mgnify:CR=1 FL=1